MRRAPLQMRRRTRPHRRRRRLVHRRSVQCGRAGRQPEALAGPREQADRSQELEQTPDRLFRHTARCRNRRGGLIARGEGRSGTAFLERDERRRRSEYLHRDLLGLVTSTSLRSGRALEERSERGLLALVERPGEVVQLFRRLRTGPAAGAARDAA